MTERVECVVIGAGVVGLAVARAIALKGKEVLLLEAEDGYGTHSSSRNSEVIHAGIYYPRDSLKALTCVRGKALLYRYCQRHGVNHRRIGKLIVANDDSQLDTLKAYQAGAQANGVIDIALLSEARLADMEPEVRAIAALWSPSTGIVDSHGFMLSLLGDFESAGGTLVCRSQVQRYCSGNDGFDIDVISDGQSLGLKSRWLVNTAGHGALHLARQSGVPYPAKNYYQAGHYFSYQGKPPFSHLVYPIPEKGTLGVHSTLDLGGQMKFGPDVEWREHLDYSFGSVRQRQAYFEKRIVKYYPGFEPSRLQPGYVGVRPRISGPGEANVDFIIAGPQSHGVDGLVQLFGIESPGLTASLAIAEQVESRLFS